MFTSQMISSETPVLFAKACEVFIIELTYRAWAFTLDSKRRTLQKSDVHACIYNTEIFDFLIDIIPNEELKVLKKYPAEGMFQVLPKDHK